MRKYNFTINGNIFEVVVKSLTIDSATVEVNGNDMSVAINSIKNMALPGLMPSQKELTPKYTQAPAVVSTPTVAAPQKTGTGAVIAPIPGLIKGLFVKEGDKVQAGQQLLVMEAMKMENIINAPHAGTVQKILVASGENVAQEQQLVIIG